MQTTNQRPPGQDGVVCQVCGLDLVATQDKPYCLRKKVCSEHLQAAAVDVPGHDGPQRFCFQCGKFQPLSCFDGTRRSCRRRLVVRRKTTDSDEQSSPPDASSSHTGSPCHHHTHDAVAVGSPNRHTARAATAAAGFPVHMSGCYSDPTEYHIEQALLAELASHGDPEAAAALANSAGGHWQNWLPAPTATRRQVQPSGGISGSYVEAVMQQELQRCLSGQALQQGGLQTAGGWGGPAEAPAADTLLQQPAVRLSPGYGTMGAARSVGGTSPAAATPFLHQSAAAAAAAAAAGVTYTPFVSSVNQSPAAASWLQAGLPAASTNAAAAAAPPATAGAVAAAAAAAAEGGGVEALVARRQMLLLEVRALLQEESLLRQHLASQADLQSVLPAGAASWPPPATTAPAAWRDAAPPTSPQGPAANRPANLAPRFGTTGGFDQAGPHAGEPQGAPAGSPMQQQQQHGHGQPHTGFRDAARADGVSARIEDLQAQLCAANAQLVQLRELIDDVQERRDQGEA